MSEWKVNGEHAEYEGHNGWYQVDVVLWAQDDERLHVKIENGGDQYADAHIPWDVIAKLAAAKGYKLEKVKE